MPMIQIIGTEIKRAGVKIGWIESTHIFDHTGKKLAYFSDKEAFSPDGTRIAYISGDYVIYPKNNTKVKIEDNNRLISGVVSDTCRAAIRLVLG